MAKKFGKFLLFTAAVGTAAAAAYYYVQKKDTANSMLQDEDDDYDDFSDDFDDDTDTSSRNYVPLNREDRNASENAASQSEEAGTDFTPLAEQVSQVAAEKPEETVEEFFDEESTDEEPPIQDN